ncbi:hypothetical protein MMU07_00250 [Aquiflexum sp. LQ15W]|uniref:hypothetical protein n=1 Tax=Cognataquiflexum nitidum TaxID=2922272 RepID=UPI001F1346FF|nr:hypothetical protein [Cognataquiflexum nitidum]MCH6197990.1 hypothetical protein [Cognataquiflexum nitidum]
MKNIILILLAVLLNQAVSAQTIFSATPPNLEDFDRGMTLTLILPSFMTSPHSNMSSLLVQNGYPHIPRGSLNYGIGLAYRIKKFEPGFDFSVGSQTATNVVFRSEILRRPLNANIFLHYHLFRKGYFTFFPIVGLSMSDTNLIASKQSSENDIGSLLQNPGTSVNMQHFSAGLLTGFGVAVSQFWEEAPGTLRMKIAYRVPFGPGYAWESFFADIESNSPVDNFPYFSIQLEIGVMANWKKGDPWMDKY